MGKEKHFVKFLSPGTFFHEETTKEIEVWDIEAAKQMARQIKERHGATPFGFRFYSKLADVEGEAEKITSISGTYYLGGKIRDYEDVCADNLPDEEILRWNMRVNNIKRVIDNTNSWKSTHEFKNEDFLLSWP